MVSAAPTILALETDSAWVVVLAVSVVTLPVALALRRLIARPGSAGAGVLLALPLLLPLVAALAYEHAVLPEVAVLKPVGTALVERPGRLLHVLLVSNGASNRVTPYAFSGSAGPWLLLIGLAASSVMLLRRFVGSVLVHRLLQRCRPLGASDREVQVRRWTSELAACASIRRSPEVRILPPGVHGAFVVGARRATVLLSEELLERLDERELEAVLAHEIAHLEARDVSIVFGAGLLRDMVAWNPVAHLAFRRLLTDRELEADRRAAAMTGRPLDLASGLVKMCELVRGGRRSPLRAGVAFLRPARQVSRRVARLLALADGSVGPTTAGTAGRMPYVVAACLVVVLGLQAGARLSEDSSALAIVVGTTHPLEGLWAPKHDRAKALRGSAAADASRKAADRAAVPRAVRYPELLDGVVKEKDLPKWMSALTKLSARLNVSPTTLRWQARAVPIFDRPAAVGPITIFRMESQLGGL